MRSARIIKIFSCLSILGAFLFYSGRVDAFANEERVSLAKGLAHYAMGQVYDLLGITDRAVLEYGEAVQYDESSYLSHLRLGAAYAFGSYRRT
jgi:hypothetical protein